MAAVSASNVQFVPLRGPDDFGAGDSTNLNLIRGVVYGDNGSTQVAGGTDTLDFNIATIIATATGGAHDGKSYTLRQCSLFQFARTSASTEYTGTVAVSSNTIQLTPKTNDWSTNATVSASGLAGGVPFGIYFVASSTT